ncbi:nuclear transport factor 2 family protein [Pseudonocardia humida]|uniref:Nuclear transport factor 2 family protein n=1 Tax=Pseudonocardia humida TaxID=2800819 RepID=A0ABT1AAP5_9PSEU|nr:nuclear transport factor 2 family protein [Pseudonocardia humida]MCO1660105.1 nuclear transport factor 2 family protein [Pseudonocardia humida]
MSANATEREIPRTDLPTAVDRYLEAHNARDADTAVPSFTPDAVVVDDGRTHTGTEAIRAWVGRSSTEWTYTSTPTSFRRGDDTHYAVVQHVEGDFPGGTVDLTYRFTLRDGLISHLVIAP